MNVLRVKDGVQFTKIAPGGFCMLAAFHQVCQVVGQDLTVSSACDGAHSGPADPHHDGNAYDVRSHDLDAQTKDRVLTEVMKILGWERFYGFLEAPGTDNEHFHFQVKKGTTYP